MSFILIYGDQAHVSSFASPDTYVAALPPNQLARGLLSAITRSGSAVNSYDIEVDRQSATAFDYVAVLNHNLSSSGTVRIRVYSNLARTTLVYDSTAQAVAAFSDALYMVHHGFAITSQTDLYITVTLEDTSVSGSIECGGIFIGKRFSPGYNMELGAKMTMEDDATVRLQTSKGINLYHGERPRRGAQFHFKLEDLDIGEEFYEIQLRSGTSKRLFFQKEANDFHQGLYTFPCMMEKLSPLDHPYNTFNSFGFNLIEEF